MQRVLLAGDTHGDLKFIEYLFGCAKKNGCQRIFQLGDFGYFPKHPAGIKYLSNVEAIAHKYQLLLYWLDGNHEDHHSLRSIYIENGEQDAEGFWKMKPHIHYSDRGHRWDWEGVSFLSLGGADSIDKQWRHQGVDWWPEELITAREAEWAASKGPVQILLTHDAPAGVTVPGITVGQFPLSEENRRVIRHDVVDKVRPQFVAHGHMHRRYSDGMTVGMQDGKLLWTRVEGFDCNGAGKDAWGILQLDNGNWQFIDSKELGSKR